jgi:N-acetyl-anhydromuramyl-L-alanine amidase AmpD
MTINTTRFALDQSQYFPQPQRKDLIVLHFTAGSTASGAHAWWTQDKGRVATAFLVDLDGAVYQTFHPAHWAYHLGMPKDNPGFANDKRSIGIEIVNVGPLRRSLDGKQLNWWPNAYSTRFCGIEETGRYVESSFRGFEYFAAFPQVQSNAVASLVASLRARFRIPATLPADLAGYTPRHVGIASHQNFRADKSDIGPAWDWEAIRAEA